MSGGKGVETGGTEVTEGYGSVVDGDLDLTRVGAGGEPNWRHREWAEESGRHLACRSVGGLGLGGVTTGRK